MLLRPAILVLISLGLMRAAAQEAFGGILPDELAQLRRQFELQALTRAKVLSEQFANALSTIAREAGMEGDYEQALAAQRRREDLIKLYSSSLDPTALTNVVILKPADARINGAVNFDRNLNALVGWKTAGSVATWDVRLNPGNYEITLSYAVADLGEAGRTSFSGPAPDLSTGGEFEFYEDSSLSGADQNRRTGTVASTGGWTEWETLTLPAIQVTRPSARFALKITKARGTGGVMNLRGIQLSPPTSGGAVGNLQGESPSGADPFITLRQEYLNRLRQAVTPVVDAYTEKLKALAEEQGSADSDAVSDFNAEARRATQMIEDPQSFLFAPSKGSRGSATPDGYREITGVTYVPHPKSTGDRFRVRQGEEEIAVRLLWVSCPPPDAEDDERIEDHTAYFGISAEDAHVVGREAKAFSEKFLAGKPLTLITRGSKDEDGNVLVAVRSGRLGELSGALVDHGLAMIRPPGLKKGPARHHEEAVLRNLAEREQAAKARPIPPGAWARSVGR